MTAKRFTETVSTGIVTDHVTGKEYNCDMRIDDKLLELLNELHEKNEQLKYNLSAHMVDLNNYKGKCSALEKENEQLKQDLIDHSALISMLEDYQALKIEETLWNLTDAKSEEEFNELYKPYLDEAKKCWR